jgi:SAM-dependent methyltransferase
MGLSRHPFYGHLINFLKTPTRNGCKPASTFLDLGTGLGQDLRKLHHDGAPINTLYGCDVIPKYERMGHRLFRDSTRFTPNHFIRGDIFSDSPKDGLYRTRGTWSVVNITMFCHNFDTAEQELIFERILCLLLIPNKGSVVMGAQTGTTKPGEMKLQQLYCKPGEVRGVFRHSKRTLIDMWQRVADRAGVKVLIWAEWDRKEIVERQEGLKVDPDWEMKNRSIVGKEERIIYFFVERLE